MPPAHSHMPSFLSSGEIVAAQPLRNSDGDVLAWNGELYDCLDDDRSDSTVLLERLSSNASAVGSVFRRMEGPFAAVFLRVRETALYFARNEFGQRSLLISLPHPLAGDSILFVMFVVFCCASCILRRSLLCSLFSSLSFLSSLLS